MHELRILPTAEADIAAAQDWYDDERPGLSERLVDEIDERLQIVRQFPEMYAVERLGYRPAPLKRFPYIIIYAVEANEVVVYRVVYDARDMRRIYRGLP